MQVYSKLKHYCAVNAKDFCRMLRTTARYTTNYVSNIKSSVEMYCFFSNTIYLFQASTDVYRRFFIASRLFDFKEHSIKHWLFLPERLREFTAEEVGSTGKPVCPACFKNEVQLIIFIKT